jgi:hypothetical protein
MHKPLTAKFKATIVISLKMDIFKAHYAIPICDMHGFNLIRYYSIKEVKSQVNDLPHNQHI